MPRITGERVVLREFRQEDISGIRCWMTDEASTRYLGGTYLRPQSWEQSERYLSDLLHGEAGGMHLAVGDKANNLRYLGQVSLMMIDNVARHGELAVVLCPDSAGKGIGREAISLMLKFAFERLNLQRVHLKVHAENTRAIRCYEACGFREEGVLRRHAYIDGAYLDVICMGILREEFAAFPRRAAE